MPTATSSSLESSTVAAIRRSGPPVNAAGVPLGAAFRRRAGFTDPIEPMSRWTPTATTSSPGGAKPRRHARSVSPAVPAGWKPVRRRDPRQRGHGRRPTAAECRHGCRRRRLLRVQRQRRGDADGVFVAATASRSPPASAARPSSTTSATSTSPPTSRTAAGRRRRWPSARRQRHHQPEPVHVDRHQRQQADDRLRGRGVTAARKSR